MASVSWQCDIDTSTFGLLSFHCSAVELSDKMQNIISQSHTGKCNKYALSPANQIGRKRMKTIQLELSSDYMEKEKQKFISIPGKW